MCFCDPCFPDCLCVKNGFVSDDRASALPEQSQGTFLNPIEERLVETGGCGGVTAAEQLRAVED